MMPFSVLRIWGLGLFGWLVLGVAIYCTWAWANGLRTTIVEREVSDPQTGKVTVVQERHVTQSNPQRGWIYLAVGIGLLSFSVGGFLPTVLVLSKPGGFGAAKHPQPAEVRTVERPDGSRLHVEFFGPKNAPTMLFTHGWSLDSTAWAYVKRDLASRFRLVFWDLPGLGQSTRPTQGDYSLEKLADDLDAVIRVEGTGPIILVGHSIGGMIQQTYGRLYPDQLESRVAGMVLVHTTYTNPLRTALGAPLWKALEKPVIVPLCYLTAWLAPLAWLSNLQSFLSGSLHWTTRFSSFAGHQTWGQLNYAAWLAVKAWPGVVARGNLAMLAFDEQTTLPEIRIPVLVIAGRHDRMTKPEASEWISKRLALGFESSIAGGHLGFWEQHSKITELITEFADRHTEQCTLEAAPTNVVTKAREVVGTSRGKTSPPG